METFYFAWVDHLAARHGGGFVPWPLPENELEQEPGAIAETWVYNDARDRNPINHLAPEEGKKSVREYYKGEPRFEGLKGLTVVRARVLRSLRPHRLLILANFVRMRFS